MVLSATKLKSHEKGTLSRKGQFRETVDLNVWTGTVRNRIIGTMLFQCQLIGVRLFGFLQNEIWTHLNNLRLTKLTSIKKEQFFIIPEEFLIIQKSILILSILLKNFFNCIHWCSRAEFVSADPTVPISSLGICQRKGLP